MAKGQRGPNKASTSPFVAKLDEMGGSCASEQLRQALSWSVERFREVRSALSDDGVIRVNRGPSARIDLLGENHATGEGSIGDLLPADASRAESDDQKLKERFLKKLKDLGGSISNARMRDALKLNDDQYFRLRNSLIDEGAVERWKGKGGTVRLIEKDEEPKRPEPAKEIEIRKEHHLYAGMSKVIADRWAKDQRIEMRRSVVDVIAQQGSRDTGGRWTRPDIVLITSNAYRYVPGRYLEIITFEVKLVESLDSVAVYEALSHRRAANRSYVLAHGSRKAVEDYRANIEVTVEVAKEHGIGLIVTTSVTEYDEWEELAEATGCELAPDRANDFIARLPDKVRERVVDEVLTH